MDEFDTLIQNAMIVEGSGKEPYKGSIAIAGDKVAAIGMIKGDAKKVIDAEGLTAVPGFIDAHSHADSTILWYPNCESYVMQGVTTFIGGQCGGSPAPLGDYIRTWGQISEYLSEFVPYKYHPPKSLYPINQVNDWMKQKFGWIIDWRTMGEYFERVEKKGISMNYAPLVGHGTIRILVMGEDYKRHSTKVELAEMRGLIQEAMEEGCIGMSTGLDYDPDVFATADEINEGVKVLKDYNAVYCPHWRRTGRRRDIAAGHVDNEKITAIMECVDTYKKTGVRLHFAHLTTGWHVYLPPQEDLEETNVKVTLDMISRESKGELDITWDVMPFLMPGGRAVLPYLCSLLQPWLRELGNRESLGKWLKVKDFREEVTDAVRRGKWYIRENYSPNTNPRWAENITVVKTKSPGLDGKSIAEIAKERGRDAWETYLDIIAEDPDARAVVARHDQILAYREPKCYNQFYTHQAGMVGLDTSVYDNKYQATNPPYGIPMINAYSAYPLFYVKFVRDNQILTLNEAVQKTATMPARVHNLEGRGVISEGNYADIVLMDLPNLKVLGDELEPRRYPKGIEHVFVNGVAVVQEGKHTGATPGRVLKRTT